jgi:hypothetical protein
MTEKHIRSMETRFSSLAMSGFIGGGPPPDV